MNTIRLTKTQFTAGDTLWFKDQHMRHEFSNITFVRYEGKSVIVKRPTGIVETWKESDFIKVS